MPYEDEGWADGTQGQVIPLRRRYYDDGAPAPGTVPGPYDSYDRPAPDDRPYDDGPANLNDEPYEDPADDPAPGEAPAERPTSPTLVALQAAFDTLLTWGANAVAAVKATRVALQKWAADGRSTAVSRDGQSLLDYRPPSIRQLIEQTRSGNWAPGDQPPFVEFAGWIYGWVLGVAVAAVTYAVLFVREKPGRLTLAVAVAVIAYLAYPH